MTDDASYAQAGGYLQGYAALAKRIEDWFAEDVQRAYELHRSLTSKRKKALDAIEGEVARLKRSLAAYTTAQEAQRRQREQEAQAEAQRAEEARLASEAAALEAQGQHDLAREVLEEGLAAPPPVVVLPSTVPVLQGVSTVENWDFELVNPALVPRQYWKVDEAAIRGVVKALKGTTRIPGVRVYRADVVRVRA